MQFLFTVQLKKGIISTCTFADNKCQYGACLFVDQPLVSISNCTFKDHKNTGTIVTLSSSGRVAQASYVLSTCQFENSFINVETGVVNVKSQTVTYENCTFLDTCTTTTNALIVLTTGTGQYIFLDCAFLCQDVSKDRSHMQSVASVSASASP